MENSCINCKYSKESADGEHCSNCSHNAVDNFEKMTNADYIRSMTDEELGKAMFNFMLKLASNPDCVMGPSGYTEWLQSPVEV